MSRIPFNQTGSATALAHPNIAYNKYWGNRNETLRLPANGSISMNLEGLETRTTVTFSNSHQVDSLAINGQPIRGAGLQQVSAFIDLVRQMAGMNKGADVTSESNFPLGAGIASSAAAFAALALASTKAAGLDLSEADLSRLARRGSGSACRSIPTGFVEWQAGSSENNSYAFSIAPPEHWALADCIAVLSNDIKPTGSTEGHALAATSPFQQSRVADAPRRLEICRNAIRHRDFGALAEIVEQELGYDACRYDDLQTATFLLASSHSDRHADHPRSPGKRITRLLQRRCRTQRTRNRGSS